MAAPKLKYAIGNAASTTTSTSMTNTDTTVPLTSTSNFQAKSGAGMVLLDEGTSTEELGYATGLSGGSLTLPLANRGLEGGSAQAHSSGASVKGILSALMWNDLIDSLINVLDQTTGALDTTKVVDLTTAQTLASKSLKTSSKVVDATDTTKVWQWSLSGATTGKTLTVTSAHTNDRTITMPDATDTLVGKATTDTLTNKRITKRVQTAADATSISPDSDSYDVVIQANTQGSGTLTINAPSGTPTDGQALVLRIKSTNSQTYSFNATYKGGTTALPSTHAGSSKYDYLGFLYNSTASKWDMVALAQAIG